MNDDELIRLLSKLDDDLIEKEIDDLMNGVECDLDSINKKAHQKLDAHNKKAKWRKRLPYVAAVVACFLFVNTVYASEISDAIKAFFNKTPVYSTMVDGSAYYLAASTKLNEDITIESMMVSDGNLEMEVTSHLSYEELGDLKIVPRDNPKAEYVPGGYSEEGQKYFYSFMNGKDNNYDIKPFKECDLTIAGKTFAVTLDQAKSLDTNKDIYTSEIASAASDIVDLGVKTFETNGKQNVQLIAAFKDSNLKLARFGQPIDLIVHDVMENTEDNGIIGSSTSSRTKDIYVVDEANNKYKLEVPADAKARPITTFEINAPKGSNLTLKLPALIARNSTLTQRLSLSIPESGETKLNKEIDLLAQKAKIKSIRRLSPTSAVLEFALNTGADNNVRIRSFMLYDKSIKKISAEFNGDKATVTLEFKEGTKAADLELSSAEFIITGDWAIKLK